MATAIAPAPNMTKKKMRSVEASRAAWSITTKLSAREQLMLQAMASHADEQFECFPSYERLASMVKVSRRQAIRIIQNLQTKGVIDFAENAGGKSKSNRYRLLINSDTFKSDIKHNGDISNQNGDISARQTVTFPARNGDMAMSPEWFEGFEEWKEWFNPPSPLFKGGMVVKTEIRQCWEALGEIEKINPEELLRQITAGTPISRQETCDACSMDHPRTVDCKNHCHGVFTRKGYRWGNWIAWEGRTGFYGPGWSNDAGCTGCRADHDKHVAERPERYRDFDWGRMRTLELRTPVYCETHGNFILHCLLDEHPAEGARFMGWQERVKVGLMHNNEPCPLCEAAFLDAIQVQEDLGLSDDEWERGGECVIRAIDVARGVASPEQFAQWAAEYTKSK